MQRTLPFIRKNIWLGLGGLTLLLRFLFSFSPEFVEKVYSRGLYLWIRKPLEGLSWISPVPLSYLLFLLLLVGIAIRVVKFIRRRKAKIRSGWKKKLGKGLHRTGSVLGGIIFFFYFLWGFNYMRQPVAESLALELRPPSLDELCEATAEAAEQAAQERARIPGISPDTLTANLLPVELSASLRTTYTALLQQLDFPMPSYVRVRHIQPGGWMLRVNVAGIYNPFVGEGNVAGALTAAQIPFTAAHEMAHGIGFGNEGTCNFWALLACEASEQPAIRYAGAFARYRYLGRELARRSRPHIEAIKTQLDPGFRADLIAARNNSRRYDGSLSRAGSKVNDTYLRAQGVPGGIKSYNRVVIMWLAWKRKSEL